MNGRRPRVIFVTGVDSSVAAVAALKLGAEDWVVKPFDDSALLMQLRALLLQTRRISVRGGTLGTRATVATIASIRCGTPVRYDCDSAAVASGEVAVDLVGTTTDVGLAEVLRRPPIDLPVLHRATATALHHVSGHYHLVTVASLAEAIGVTANYLLERFRTDLGLTTREYIARVRIEVMKQRLSQAGCPSLDRLAEEVGFCDAAHVHKVFMRYAEMLSSRP